MTSDHKWKWAGIVSLISIGGVLITEIAANVVGGYISEQIKAWQVPELASAAPSPATEGNVMVAAMPVRGAKETRPDAAPAVKPLPPPEPLDETSATPKPEELPPAADLTGAVEQVLDTATLKVLGETIHLAGINGFGPPYRDQFAQFIQEQGDTVRCMPNGSAGGGARHTCFVKNVDLALAALTNGAARIATDASAQYRHAEDEARRNRRGIFQ